MIVQRLRNKSNKKRSTTLILMLFLVVTMCSSAIVGAWYTNLGYIFLNRANTQESISFDTAVAYYNKSHNYFNKALKWRDLPNIRSGLQLSAVSSDNFIHIGQVRQSLHELSQALHWYYLAIETGDNVSDGWYQIGFLMNWLPPDGHRDSQKSLELLLKALELDDFSSDVVKAETLYRIASLQCNYMGRGPQVCVPYYEQAEILNPDHAFTLMELGRQYYLQTHDLSVAESKIRQALNGTSDFGMKWAYFHLGELYCQAEDYALARKQYELALEIDPYFDQALDAIKKVP